MLSRVKTTKTASLSISVLWVVPEIKALIIKLIGAAMKGCWRCHTVHSAVAMVLRWQPLLQLSVEAESEVGNFPSSC